jgi:hypothetical protein
MDYIGFYGIIRIKNMIYKFVVLQNKIILHIVCKKYLSIKDN